MEAVIALLTEKKLKVEVVEMQKSACIICFDVWAKPGAKVEKVFVSGDGNLTIQTRARPVEGEANYSIMAAVSDLFGTAKSHVQIIRGEKNRQKRIKVLLEFSVGKKRDYYLNKLSAILIPEA